MKDLEFKLVDKFLLFFFVYKGGSIVSRVGFVGIYNLIF